MQFIFASDKENGYGLMYTETKKSEPESIMAKIHIPVCDDIDIYGFVSFGTNGNRPAFFEIKKDKSYVRSAYYVHGIYHDATPEYFGTDAYEKDIFARFINQEDLDNIRDKKTTELPATYDATTAFTEDFNVNPTLFKDILVKLYCDESLILTMNDEDYSADNAKRFIKKVFKYLLPSLRKSCTYVIGTVDVDADKNSKIKIVPQKMLETSKERVINLSIKDYSAEPKFDVSEKVSTFVELITNSNDAKRAEIFRVYEQLFNGYGSYYNSRKLVEYIGVLKRDPQITESIITNYMYECDDPNSELLPEFVKACLVPYYSRESYFTDQLKIMNDVELFDYDKVLDDNIIPIKKLFVFNEQNMDQFIYNYALSIIKNITLTDELIDSYEPIISNSMNIDTTYFKKYQQRFHSAMCRAYSIVMGHIKVVNETKQKVSSYIEKVLQSKMNDDISFEDLKANVQNSIKDVVQKVIDNCKYDLTAFVDAEVTSQYRRYTEMLHNNKVNSVMESINRITSLSGSETPTFDVDAELVMILDCPDECRKEVDKCIIKYAVYLHKNNKVLNSKFFKYLGQNNPKKLRSLVDFAGPARFEIMLPILGWYYPIDKLSTVLGDLMLNMQETIEALEKDKLNFYVQTVQDIFARRSLKEQVPIPPMSDYDKRGLGKNTKKLMAAIAPGCEVPTADSIKPQKAEQDDQNGDEQKRPRKSNGKKKTSWFAVVMLIISVLIVAACTVLLLLHFGIIGGNNGNDGTIGTSGTASDIVGKSEPIGSGSEPAVNADPDNGENETPDNGGNETPDNGGNETPDNGENETPDNGENETPDNGENETPDNGENVTPDNGENVTPDNGENETPDNGENVTPDNGGDVTPDNGVNETPDNGGDVTPDNGGDVTPDNGGNVTPDNGGNETSDNDMPYGTV